MGLFNLKKSKTDAEQDFEASDEWLMGLADDDPDQFAPGPNSSLPAELQSLAPPVTSDAAPIAEITRDDESLTSGWHLPDLEATQPDHAVRTDQFSVTGPTTPDRPAPDRPVPPAQEAIEWAAPPPPPPPPAMLFGDRQPRVAPIDPFPHDATVAEPVTDPTDPTDPTDEGPGFSSVFFADEPVETNLTEPDATARPAGTQLPDSNAADHEPPLLDPPPFGRAPLPDQAVAATDDPSLDNETWIDDASNDDAWFRDHPTDDRWADGADIEDAELDDTGPCDASAEAANISSSDPTGPAPSWLPPRGPEPDMLCEILGVEPGADWAELRAAHGRALIEYDPDLESDEDRIALARSIRREINSTYATLRLLASK